MNTQLDLSMQDDVYGEKTKEQLLNSNTILHHCTFHVVTERSSSSLAQIFGLLATLSIVPVAAGSSYAEDSTMNIVLEFQEIFSSSASSLKGKVGQLIGTISVEMR